MPCSEPHSRQDAPNQMPLQQSPGQIDRDIGPSRPSHLCRHLLGLSLNPPTKVQPPVIPSTFLMWDIAIIPVRNPRLSEDPEADDLRTPSQGSCCPLRWMIAPSFVLFTTTTIQMETFGAHRPCQGIEMKRAQDGKEEGESLAM